jgi:hypothetical protein
MGLPKLQVSDARKERYNSHASQRSAQCAAHLRVSVLGQQCTCSTFGPPCCKQMTSLLRAICLHPPTRTVTNSCIQRHKGQLHQQEVLRDPY